MKQFHYIYIYGSVRLPVGLDTLEDEIFALIEGQGDVAGVGTGEIGWNIDIEFESLNSANFILMSSLRTFRRYGICEGVTFDINGHREALADLNQRHSESLGSNKTEAQQDGSGQPATRPESE